MPDERPCADCVFLETLESRLRTAYEGTLEVLDNIGSRPAIEHNNEDIKKLADHLWLQLEGAIKELKDHREGHRTRDD